MTEAGYKVRIAQQVQQFADLGALWPTSAITSYWMDKHIVPRMQAVFPEGGVFDLYYQRVANAARNQANKGTKAVAYSIGAGDCNIEINLARRLRRVGISNVTIIASELSQARLDRAAVAADEAGVREYFEFSAVDLNGLHIGAEVDVFIAHHTL